MSPVKTGVKNTYVNSVMEETWAGSRSPQDREGGGQVVRVRVCTMGDVLLGSGMRYIEGYNLYFKKITLAMMWCMVSCAAKSKANEPN